MRTTLDIAEDVLLAAKALGKRENKSAGQIISELARRALQTSISVADNREDSFNSEEAFLGFRPLPKRGVIVTAELIDKIREEEGI